MDKENINLEYSIQRKEYLSFFILEIYKKTSMKIMVLIGLILLGLSFYHLPELKLGEYFPVSLTISFGVTFVVLAPLIFFWLGLKKYNVHPELHETQKVTIDSKTLTAKGITFENSIPIDAIDNLQLNTKMYYLTGQGKFLLIPTRCLSLRDKEKLNLYLS